MKNSKLHYRIWLTCLYLMELTKKGFSATEMQNLLGHKRYEAIWLMMHKFRIQMGERDKKYQLDEFKELDESFFAGHRKVGLNDAGKSVKPFARCIAISNAKKKLKGLHHHVKNEYMQ